MKPRQNPPPRPAVAGPLSTPLATSTAGARRRQLPHLTLVPLAADPDVARLVAATRAKSEERRTARPGEGKPIAKKAGVSG